MPSIKIQVRSSKGILPISASDIISRYFFGIALIDQDGNQMSEESINFYIEAAVNEIEGYLNLKLTKQVITESLSYFLNDYKAWGFLPTSFPVLEVEALTGFIGETEQIEFPKEWLSAKKTNTAEGKHRAVYIVPTVGAAKLGSVVYSGVTPNVGWFGQATIPNYWTIKYCTSFERPPADIMNVVGMLASINIFHQLGDIILGAGIASQSIGIDGLSQSISTTSSATNAGYGARITGYLADLKKQLPELKAKYDGMVLMSM